jgi:hypothetical protein
MAEASENASKRRLRGYQMDVGYGWLTNLRGMDV